MYDSEYYDYEYDFYCPAWTDRLVKRPNTLSNNLLDCGFILVFLAILPFMIFVLVIIALRQIWQDRDLIQ